jgi:hypothetical protein
MRVVVFNAMLSSWKGDAGVVGASSLEAQANKTGGDTCFYTIL